MLDVAAILISLTALLAYLNHRLLKLPATIGVMVLALVVSLLLQVATGAEVSAGGIAWLFVEEALALSPPPGPERDLILTITYGVVLFSILVRGLTVGRPVRASLGQAGNAR